MSWKIGSLRGLIGLFILACAIACRADADKDAAKTADNFLAALKIFELPEGKQAVAESSWSANLDKLPVLLEEEKLFEGMLSTDVPGVVGYKRLIQARVQSQGGLPLTEKYLLVSYKDQQMGKWKIWEFRKISGTDVEHEIDAAKQEIGHSESLKDQFTYRNYAYWLALGGRLLAAKEALETALAIDRPHPEEYFDEQNCQAQINAIKLIVR